MNEYVSLVCEGGVFYAMTRDGVMYEIYWDENKEEWVCDQILRLPQFIERAA